MATVGNANHSSYMNTSRLSYVTVAEFSNNIFTYKTTTANFQTTGAMTSFAAQSMGPCPKGRVLRENGRKYIPGPNPTAPGFNTYMVGVYDNQTMLSGFIDPNGPQFAIYNTDKPNFLVDGVDPVGGLTDHGAPVYTNSSVEATTWITADTGDITALLGNIIATVGHIVAGAYISAGTYITAGTYVYSGSGVGYTTGSGGAATQLANKGTAVTLDKPTGQITMSNSQLNAGATVAFTLNNTFIGADDMLVLNIPNNASLNYTIGSGYCVANSCAIYVRNITGVNLSEPLVIKFAVIKSKNA